MKRITLTLEPAPDRHGRPVSVRLRIALKFLLRSTALRCVDVRGGEDAAHWPPDASEGPEVDRGKRP